MRSYDHPRDAGLPEQFRRRVGTPAWKLAAVARCAPEELDAEPEESVRLVVRGTLDRSGLPFFNLREALYGWLKSQIAKDGKCWQAKALLHELKSLPDFVAFKAAPEGWPCCLALPLEVKRAKGGRSSPGQDEFAAKVRGVIAHGVEPSLRAVHAFLNFTPPAATSAA